MKSDRVIKLSLTAVAAALAILVTGCYYMPGANGGTAKVAVGVKGVPVNLVSAALVVTAPGMAPITATAALTSNSITVSVPAGTGQDFHAPSERPFRHSPGCGDRGPAGGREHDDQRYANARRNADRCSGLLATIALSRSAT